MPPMHRARTVVVMFVLSLLVLGALAYAGPPDPTWVGSLCEPADYGEVIAECGMDTRPEPRVPTSSSALIAVTSTAVESGQAPFSSPILRAPPRR